MATRDPIKLKAKKRRCYLKHREKRLAYAAARRRPYGEWTPAQREAHRIAKVRARRKAGVPPRRKSDGPWLWEQNAKQAWAWWLKTCPNWWLRAYWRAQGAPWRNPRLTKAQQWRIRYWCDPEYRASQIEKVQRLKVKRAALIDATDDGTLTGTVIVGLFAAAKRCHYCAQPMRSVQKSLDHVVPVSKGGAHSITNVVIACKTCNYRKGSKMIATAVAA